MGVDAGELGFGVSWGPPTPTGRRREGTLTFPPGDAPDGGSRARRRNAPSSPVQGRSNANADRGGPPDASPDTPHPTHNMSQASSIAGRIRAGETSTQWDRAFHEDWTRRLREASLGRRGA